MADENLAKQKTGGGANGSGPHPNGVSFVPISITGDTDPVTGATTVNYAATMDYPGEPDLILGFYEAKQTSPTSINMIPISVSPTPTVSWNNGVANFSVPFNSALFTQLSSNQTNFAVTAQIDGVESWGMSNLGVNHSTEEDPQDPPD